MAKKTLQIDVLVVGDSNTICNLYADGRCIKIAMLTTDYEALKTDGVFIRDGKTRDSAQVLNTTKVYSTI